MNFDLELAEQLVYLYKKLCSIDDFLIIRECADGHIQFSSRLGGSYRNEHFNQIIHEEPEIFFNKDVSEEQLKEFYALSDKLVESFNIGKPTHFFQLNQDNRNGHVSLVRTTLSDFLDERKGLLNLSIEDNHVYAKLNSNGGYKFSEYYPTCKEAETEAIKLFNKETENFALVLQKLNDEDLDLTNGLTMLANSQGISTPDFIKYMKDPDLIPQDHSAKSKFLNSVYKELFNYDSSLNFAAVGLCFKTTIKNLVTLLSQQKLEEKCLNELEPESYQGNSYFTLDPKLTHCCLYDPINGGGPLGFEIELSNPVKIPLANALIDFFDGKSISSCYTVAQIAREDELNREYVQDVLKEQPCHLMNDDEIKKAEEKLLDYNRANSKFQGKGR